MKLPHWIASSMAASLILVTPHLTHANSSADDVLNEQLTPVNFLVSLQDEVGNHVCNGSYIGHSHILTEANCYWPGIIPGPVPLPGIPITTLPKQPIESLIPQEGLSLAPDMMRQLSAGVPLQQAINEVESSSIASLNGAPTHAVFLLSEGYSDPIPLVRDMFFSKQDVLPVSGGELIYTVRSGPEGAQAILLADDELLDDLLADATTTYTLIGKNVLPSSNEVSRQNYQASSNCISLLGPEKYKRNICLAPTSSHVCSWDAGAVGASMFTTLENGQMVLVGFKGRNSCDYFGGDSTFIASSRFPKWANLHALKQQGLAVASAYEFGEQEVASHQSVTITLENQSDQNTFSFDDFSMSSQQAISVKQNNCVNLLPSESCSITLQSRVPDAINYLEQLSFTSQGLEAGIFVALNGYQERKIAGDKRASWKLNGWKSKHGNGGRHLPHHKGHSLYTSTDFSTLPSLSRNQYVDGPTTMNITYRADGNSPFVLMVDVRRKSLSANSTFSLFPGNFLPATHGEWQTKSIEIKEMGTYRVNVKRALISVVGELNADVEVRNICFGDCEQSF